MKSQKINKTFRTWKDLVNDNQIDIVAIAVPSYLQIDILKECLKKISTFKLNIIGKLR